MRFALRPGVRRLFRLPLRDAASIHAEIDEELESLLAARVDDLAARGMTRDDARALVVNRLGSIDLVRNQLYQSAELRERRMHFNEYLDDLAQDVRYAARGLARRPAFTVVAVLTLAIGIGATTAIFSAVNVLLLRPLPYENPSALMKVSLVVPARANFPGSDHMVWSFPKYTVFRDGQRVFSDFALYAGNQFTVTSGEVERMAGEYVGADYLRTLGMKPAHGRDLDRSVDGQAGAAREILLSDALWQRRFNANPSAIGETIDLDHTPYTIIGITPPGFRGLGGQADAFVPIASRAPSDLTPFSHEFSLVARRKPGVTELQAAAAVKIIGQGVNDAYPDTNFPGKPWGAAAEALDALRVAPVVKRSLLVLFGALGFVLLIACVNVANLLLGRATARRREIAVRLAIGAGRGRLVRLLLTESVMLAFAGAVASVFVAWSGVHAVNSVDPSITQRAQRGAGLGAVAFSAVTLDWAALSFTFGLALVVGIVFGLVPALNSTRASLTDALKDGAATIRRGKWVGASSGRRLLVVTEVALALVLLAGSGLMIRSLTNLLGVDSGFDGTNVLTLRLSVPPGSLVRDSLPGFYAQLLERVGAVPGVTDASLSSCAPLSGGCSSTVMRLFDRPEMDMAHAPLVRVIWTTPTWFATMRVPVKRGRVFVAGDGMGSQKVVVLTEAAAKTLWPNEDPIGKHIELGQGRITDGEVIGIVGDVRQHPDSAEGPGVYLSYLQSPTPGMILYARTPRDPATLGAAIRKAIHEVAPQYPIYDVQTMTARTATATAQARFSAILLAAFALTALSLSAVGIYGVMSLAVSSRTREIGIRIALGADRNRVQRLVVGEGVALVGAGAALGVVGALVCTRVLQSLLFGLSPSDPVTYVSIVALLAVAAVTASWLPARRASRVDPVVALRAD